jgi:Fur family iron response transcriptional regulator
MNGFYIYFLRILIRLIKWIYSRSKLAITLSIPTTVMTQQELQELLQLHRIRATPQRLSIANVLFSGPRHMSAEQVIRKLRQAGYQASKATVYNTLGLFSKAGLVREVIADPGCVYYDSNTTPHQHLYNSQTATLTDISPQDINVQVMKELPEDMEVESIDVIVRVRKRKP